MQEVWKDIWDITIKDCRCPKRKKNINKRLQVEVCVMKQKKGQWTPKVTSLRKVIVDGEEQWVEFDPATYIIPAGHQYYTVLRSTTCQNLSAES